jgi:hypothetical protein
MSRAPIDQILDAITWEPIANTLPTSGLPYVTHRGLLTIGSCELECLQLSDGQRIFTEESLLKFFGLPLDTTAEGV